MGIPDYVPTMELEFQPGPEVFGRGFLKEAEKMRNDAIERNRRLIDSAEYCLTHGKEGGGYVYCTSNIPFRGLPLERYQLVLDVWKRIRNY